MRIVALIAGIALTIWLLRAAIMTMLLPRSTNVRLARAVNAAVWRVAMSPLALLPNYRAQDRWLAGAAPVTVLLLLVAYSLALVASFALVMFGLGLDLPQALSQSGATFTTLGVSENAAPWGVAAAFAAAFVGAVVIAIFVSYLIGLYSAYATRENLMVALAVEAGEPAWGPELLARSHALRAPFGTVPSPGAWIAWIAQVRTGQQVTPVLAQFRSTSPSRHWVVSLLAVLDATALQAALRPTEATERQIRLLAFGIDTLAALDEGSGRDASLARSVEQSLLAALAGTTARLAEAGLDEAEWAAGAELLIAAGAATAPELDEARGRFCAIRALYFPAAYSLAKRLHAVPAPWSGTRRPAIPVIAP